MRVRTTRAIAMSYEESLGFSIGDSENRLPIRSSGSKDHQMRGMWV